MNGLPDSATIKSPTNKSSIERPVLITGSHRSGTTWVGKIINTAENTRLFWEPFSPYNLSLYLNLKNKPWFYAVTNKQSEDFKYRMHHLIHNEFYNNHTNWLSFLLKYKFSPRKIRLLYRLSKQPKRYIPILKDPIALFSSEWLSEHLHTKNIVIIRHPAGFISSLIKNNWHFDFQNFYSQPQLMANQLLQFKPEIEHHLHGQHQLIDQGILLWNIIHDYIFHLKQNNPDWYFFTLKDFAIRPFVEFEAIFRYLEMPVTNKVLEMIENTTSSANQAERGENVNMVYRDSKGIVDIWKNRLTESEQQKIHDQCIWQHFYKPDDWR